MSRAAALLALALVGCGPPKQGDYIVRVDHQGLAARMRMLCRLGMAREEARAACDSPAATPSMAGAPASERASPAE